MTENKSILADDYVLSVYSLDYPSYTSKTMTINVSSKKDNVIIQINRTLPINKIDLTSVLTELVDAIKST